MNNSPVPLHLVVALPAEAKPLVQHYGLQKQQSEHGFDIYRKEHIALVVSGVGKINAAAAVSYLQAVCEFPQHAVWLNVGIAGLAGKAPGEVFLAHKITDSATGKSWYPVRIARSNLASETLCSVDVVSDEYPEDSALDMEAAGFFTTALRFSEAELVQCLKVVSDNSAEGQRQINGKTVSDWIKAAIPALDETLEQIKPLAAELRELDGDPDFYEDYLTQWRFTVSQKIQLRDVLRRWQVLDPQAQRDPSKWNDVENTKALMFQLRKQVDALPLNFRGIVRKRSAQ